MFILVIIPALEPMEVLLYPINFGKTIMAAVARLGDYCTGHGCWPPRPGASASPDVFVNGIPAHRVGDGWMVHCCKTCHPGTVASGSGSVFINGRPAARIGDSISCGSLIAQGSSDVDIGSSRTAGGMLSGVLNVATGLL